MKQFFSTAALLLFVVASYAQTNCKKMLQDAIEAQERGEYIAAIQKYNAAKKCDPKMESTVDSNILVVFKKINNLRDEAEHNRFLADKKAKEAKVSAEKARKAEEEANNAERASRNAVTALKVARTDPTIGLRMAEYVMNSNPKNQVPVVVFSDIYDNKNNEYYLQKIQSKHRAQISSVAFSPDGTKLLLGTYRVAELWDLTQNEDQKPVIFSPHWNILPSVAISPNGQTVLTSSRDTVKLWEMNGNLTKWFVGHSKHISSVHFSPDGTNLLTTSFDSTAKLWTLDGQLLSVFKGHQGRIFSSSFSPDGTTVLTGSEDGLAKLWSLDGNELVTFNGLRGKVSSVAFSPDGQTVLTGSSDNIAILWTIDGKKIKDLRGHKSEISAVKFAPDGRTLLTASYDGSAKIWTADGWEKSTLTGHNSPITDVAFYPDGKGLVTASDDGTAKIWKTASENLAITKDNQLDGDFDNVIFKPEGPKMVTGSANGQVFLNDPGYGDSKVLLTAYFSKNTVVSAVSYSPDKTNILTAGADTLKLWSAEEQFLLAIPDTGKVTSLIFSPSGNSFIALHDNGKALLWDINGRKLTTFATADTSKILCVAFSPDGNSVSAGANDGKIRTWDISGKLIHTLTGHTDDVITIAYTSDGKTFLTGSNDKTAILWSAEGKRLSNLKGHYGAVYKVAISPDKAIVATLSYDSTIKLWNPEGVEISTIPYYAERSTRGTRVGFTRDSQWLVVYDNYRGVNFWMTPKHFISANVIPVSLLTMEQNGLILTDEEVLSSREPDLLVYRGNKKFDLGEWDQAQRYYQKAQAIHHTTNAVIGMYKVSRIKSTDFDIKTIIQSNDPNELLQYAQIILPTIELVKKTKLEKLRELFSLSKQLEEKAFSLNPAIGKQTRYRLADSYNSLGYYLLEIKEPIGALASELAIIRGLEIDPSHPYLLTNLPLAYMFQNRWADAEKIYREQKDLECAPGNGFPLYKDAFLDDLHHFENEGIIHPNFAKVRAIMQEKPTTPPTDDNSPPNGQ